MGNLGIGPLQHGGLGIGPLQAASVPPNTIQANAILASRTAFGSGSIGAPSQSITITAELASRVAFGSGSISTGISSIYILPSRVAFGFGALIQQAYISVFVNGIERSKYVLDGSLQITNPLSNSTTASFGMWVPTGDPSVTPQVGQEVLVYVGNVRIFGGSVEQPFQTAYQALGGHAFSGSAGGGGGTSSATGGGASASGGVQCTDFSNLLDRRFVGQYYDGINVPTTLSAIVADIVRIYFSQDGISYDDSDGDPGINIGPQLFSWVTGRQAFNQLSSLTGWDFSVDPFKVLRFYPASSGLKAAPFSIADNTGHLYAESLGVEYYRSKYRNRQGIRTPNQGSMLWSDTFSAAIPGPFPNEPQPPDGVRRFFGELYNFISAPFVTVNTNPQVVVTLDEIGSIPTYDWYWIPGPTGMGYGIQQNPSHAALTSADTLVISYQTQLAPIYWVQNNTQIAERAAIEGNSGIYEDVQDAPNGVTDPAAIIAYANGLLARYGNNGIPYQATYSTRLPGMATAPIFAGMLQQIVTSNPLLNFTGLISNVTWQDVDGQFMQMSVTVLSDEYQGDFTQFFAALVAQSQVPQPTAFNPYVLLIAPSYPGITNPGVTGGYVTPGSVIISNAVELLQSFQVYMPTANAGACHFALLVNGSGVIAVDFAAGETGTKTAFASITAPIRLFAGDVLKVELDGGGISAVKDATAQVQTSISVT